MTAASAALLTRRAACLKCRIYTTRPAAHCRCHDVKEVLIVASRWMDVKAKSNVRLACKSNEGKRGPCPLSVPIPSNFQPKPRLPPRTGHARRRADRVCLSVGLSLPPSRLSLRLLCM